jgi:hypothetical protein
MRTAIFMGAMIISFTLNQDIIFPVSMGWFMVVGLVSFILMDIIDFFRPLSK